MAARKDRITVTVDSALVRAGVKAVASGRAATLSGWVNLALAERLAKERKLQALSEAVLAYEARFGAISEAEIALQERADRRAAVVVRERSRGVRRTRSKPR